LNILAPFIGETRYYDNNTFALYPSFPKAVQNYVIDSTPPNVTSYNFNLNNGTLTFQLDEPIDCLVVNTSKITFTHPDFSGERFVLTGGSHSPTNLSMTLTVTLLKDDVDELKINNFLAVNDTTTFLDLAPGLFEDVAGLANPSVAYTNLNGGFTPDIGAPVLEKWTADILNNFLIFTFTEPINPAATTLYRNHGPKSWRLP
jgi:hypothetical protein